MIQFRQKDFTIQEGYYSGPKELEKIPGAVEVIGKSMIGGSALGGLVGKVATGDGSGGLETGAKSGIAAGIALKVFINHLHKPMTKVKYQGVDKEIRRKFGIYDISGITVGDNVGKRSSIEDKFSFNDKKVSGYKLNFAIAENKVVMYTFGLTTEELTKINKILDRYCKKYFGMKYESTLLNQKINSYSVNITFTNYETICNFIVELSDTLLTKINLLDNNVPFIESDEKTFSVKEINKYDLIKILGKSGITASSLLSSIKGNWKTSLSCLIMSSLTAAMEKITNDEAVKAGAPSARENFGNPYLESVLKKFHYIEGFNYTIGDEKAVDNISMTNGRFILTTDKNSESQKTIDDVFWKNLKNKIFRNDTGRVIIYTYTIESRQDFEFIIKKLMSTKITFNIFEK